MECAAFQVSNISLRFFEWMIEAKNRLPSSSKLLSPNIYRKVSKVPNISKNYSQYFTISGLSETNVMSRASLSTDPRCFPAQNSRAATILLQRGNETPRSSGNPTDLWWNFQWLMNSHWIGLRENLQETHGFLPSNIGLSCKFSHHPIL